MVLSVELQSSNDAPTHLSCEFKDGRLVLDSKLFDSSEFFQIIIRLEKPIVYVRSHDYRWIEIEDEWNAGEFSPKIVKLEGGTIVQANIASGIWTVNKKQPNTLKWHFNSYLSGPITHYNLPNNFRSIVSASYKYSFPVSPTLLFSKSGIEFSRSKIPFSSIVCFTDHCDFDTRSNLEQQREFFKKNNIKVTKGFFLHHFSKRDNNASFQNDGDEYLKWIEDGHELAYHSLSQSIKSLHESQEDFKNFVFPMRGIPTWIDHGFQPYNLSLFSNFQITDNFFAENLKTKGIRTMWNYVDSGTATLGVINQLNASDFTIAKFDKANKNLKWSSRISAIIKNIIFHHYADEQNIQAYKLTAGNIKQIIYNRNIKAIPTALKSILKILHPVLYSIFKWNSESVKVYKLARFTPTIFKHTIEGQQFYIFQTIEMINFKQALHPQNIDKLVRERGMFIAHTYFSAPYDYHEGRMFRTPSELDQEVCSNFQYLGDKIKDELIWNPVLDDLVSFLGNFEHILLDLDKNGEMYVVNPVIMEYRIAL